MKKLSGLILITIFTLSITSVYAFSFGRWFWGRPWLTTTTTTTSTTTTITSTTTTTTISGSTSSTTTTTSTTSTTTKPENNPNPFDPSPTNGPPTVTIVGVSVKNKNGVEVVRPRNYVFDHESINWTARVQDPDGTSNIIDVLILMNGSIKQKCWTYTGLNATTADYECLWYLYGIDGTYNITINATDSVGNTGQSDPETWIFNPPYNLSVKTNDTKPIGFQDGGAGDTVYSTNYYNVSNPSIVKLDVYITGKDFYGIDGAARCPWSNVLSIRNFDYSLDQTTWTTVPKYNINKPYKGGNNITTLDMGEEVHVWFRLRYPWYCVGKFGKGGFQFWAYPV